MKLSTREMTLSAITIGIVVIGVSWLLGMPLVQRWMDAREQRLRLAQQRTVAERLVAMRPRWEDDYTQLRARIPQHGATDPVTAEMLKMIRRLADEHQMSISRIEPDKEQNIGDLYEVAIDCTWESTLESMVQFLYAVQTQGAILDVRQLTVTPAQGAPGRLKGTFTVFVAFGRRPAEAPGASTEATPPTG